MTKADIVKEVSKSTGIEATAVMAVVEGFMEAVNQAYEAISKERGI